MGLLGERKPEGSRVTFLQLCQFVQAQIGTSTDLPWGGPSATTGQTGQYLEIVNWVNMAYKDIQNDQQDWLWRWKQGSLALTNTQYTYTLAQIQAQITDFETYKDLHFINDVRYSLCYDTTTGVSDETFAYYYPYQDFRGWLDRQTRPTGKPTRYTIQPNLTLELSPTPDAGRGTSYTFVFDYRIALDTLSGDSDTPLMPVNFHEAIAWKAVMYWAMQRENQAKYGAAKLQYDRIMYQMRSEQLPETTFYLREFY